MWGIFTFLGTLPIVQALEKRSAIKNTRPFLGQLTRYDLKCYNHDMQKNLYQEYIFFQRDVKGNSLIGKSVWERRDMYLEELHKAGFIEDLTFKCDLEEPYTYKNLEEEDRKALGRVRQVDLDRAYAYGNVEEWLDIMEELGTSKEMFLNPKPIDLSEPLKEWGHEWGDGRYYDIPVYFGLLLRAGRYEEARNFYKALNVKAVNEWIFQFLDEFDVFPPTDAKRKAWKPYYEHDENPPGLFQQCQPGYEIPAGMMFSSHTLPYHRGYFQVPVRLHQSCNLCPHDIIHTNWDGSISHEPINEDWNLDLSCPEYYLKPNQLYHYKYPSLDKDHFIYESQFGGTCAEAVYNKEDFYFYSEMDCQYVWRDPSSGKVWTFRHRPGSRGIPDDMRQAAKTWAIKTEEEMKDIIQEGKDIEKRYNDINKYFSQHPHYFGKSPTYHSMSQLGH